jgi:predicted membrane metal-binding protein
VAVATGFDFAVADKPQAWPEYVRRWIMAGARCNEGRLVLWLPVAMAAGIGSYFALPVEPAMFAVGIALILAAVCGYWLIRSGPSAPGLLLMLALTGFLAAKFHTSIASGPSLASPTDALQISGFVEEIVRGPGRSTKLIVRLESAAGLDASQRPKKLRITAPAQKELRVGHFVEGQARLFPLLTPVMPGGYDFARAQWLEGIGAGGHARTAFHIRDDRRPPLPLAFKGQVEALRSAIAERVKSALPGRSGVLAVALITGERASLPQEMKDSLQGSGLAHIVSISGLHMSLVAGGFFWVIRALLALSPDLSLRRPIKKWSAATALLAGATYLALSGGEVPTQRSYIMVASAARRLQNNRFAHRPLRCVAQWGLRAFYRRSGDQGRNSARGKGTKTVGHPPGTAKDRRSPQYRCEDSIAPYKTDELALHFYPVGPENAGLIGGVGCLQRDRIPLAAKPLKSGFLIIDQRHDDLASLGQVGLADHHRIAIQYAGIDHRIALDLEREVISGTQHLRRHSDIMGVILYGRDRHTGGNPAHHWNDRPTRDAIGTLRHGLDATERALDDIRAKGALLFRRGQARRYRFRKLDDFQGAGAMRKPAYEASFLKRGDQPVDTGLRTKVECRFHLIEGRRHARLLEALVDKHQQFELFARQHCVQTFSTAEGSKLLDQTRHRIRTKPKQAIIVLVMFGNT